MDSENIGIGSNALQHTTTGDYNTALGFAAGIDGNASSCVYLGYVAGNSNTTDNRLFINNAGGAYPLIYGEFDNDIVAFGNGADAFNFAFSRTGGESILHGGNTANDILVIGCNSSDGRPFIRLNPNDGGINYIDMELTATGKIRYEWNNVLGGYQYLSGGDWIHEGSSNTHLYLKTNGTGLVKFGTYTAGAATDSIGYITIVDAGGTTRKLMVQA